MANSDIGPQIKMQLDQMIANLSNMSIGAPLVWLWTWDIITFKYNEYKEVNEYSDYVVTDGTTLDKIWEKLWANPPSEFTLEYGAEYVDEAVTDWMINEEFIALLEDDGWLEDDEDLDEDDSKDNAPIEAEAISNDSN